MHSESFAPAMDFAGDDETVIESNDNFDAIVAQERHIETMDQFELISYVIETNLTGDVVRELHEEQLKLIN